MPIGGYVWTMSFWAMMYASVRAMKGSQSIQRTATALAWVAILTSVGALFSEATGYLPDVGLRLAGALVSLAFLTLTTYQVLRDVLLSWQINTNRIVGAACVYVMLALTWAYAFQVVYLLHPESFAFSETVWIDADRPFSSVELLVYFSFVTLTTLGYGDITPMGSWARLLASSEALVGQLYLTILVARLVGLHLMDQHQSRGQ